jgi:hypothetical protein
MLRLRHARSTGLVVRVLVALKRIAARAQADVHAVRALLHLVDTLSRPHGAPASRHELAVRRSLGGAVQLLASREGHRVGVPRTQDAGDGGAGKLDLLYVASRERAARVIANGV